MRMTSRCQDRSRSLGGGISGSSEQTPTMSVTHSRCRFASLGISDSLSWSIGFPVFYLHSFHIAPVCLWFCCLSFYSWLLVAPLYFKASFFYVSWITLTTNCLILPEFLNSDSGNQTADINLSLFGRLFMAEYLRSCEPAYKFWLPLS